MLRRTILLIYCTGWVAAAAVSGDIVDNCDYYASPAQSRCGDICIDYNRNCICGEERLKTANGPSHCCVDHVDQTPVSNQQCDEDLDVYGEGICQHGTVLNKTQTCNGHCYNDYSVSEKIGRDSQFRCGNHCVPVWRMCRGYSQCEDGSDVTACDDSLTCVAWRGERDRRQLVSSLSDQHFYCNYGDYRNNGEYDTISRVDETDLDIRNQKVRLNFTSITECDNDVDLGLMCGDICWPNYNWCRGDSRILCDVPGGKFTSDNKALCGYTPLWKNTTCENFYDSGRKAALGLRCSGGAQHCAYPWYLSSNYYYEVREQLSSDICTVSILVCIRF